MSALLWPPEGVPPPLPPEIDAFKHLLASYGKRKGSPMVQNFVKKTSIPYVDLPAKRPCLTTLNLAERGLIGKFTSLWSCPKENDGWVQRNWRPLVFEGIHNHLVGRGYYVFVFESADDQDLIFQNGPYFMGPQGLYLNK